MCLLKDLHLKAAKSPRRRLSVREISKPRLSRKLVPGIRVDLNQYWSKFEEMTSLLQLQSPGDASGRRPVEVLDNEINENLSNELLEMGK